MQPSVGTILVMDGGEAQPERRLHRIGQMYVKGAPSARFGRALKVVADHLHAEFDRQVPDHAQRARNACVFCSLIVRDFLRHIGFDDAEVLPVTAVLQTKTSSGTTPYGSIGSRAVPVPRGKWPGHVVATAPSAGYLLDTTMFRMTDDWHGPRGMIAVPLLPTGLPRLHGLEQAGCLAATDREGRTFQIAWLHNPANDDWQRMRENHDVKVRPPIARALRNLYVQATSRL